MVESRLPVHRAGLFGAIEAGGTKFVCAIGDANGQLLMEARTPTRDPATTFAEVFGFFRAAQARFGPLQAFGLAAFGPLELNRASSRYGFTLETPKSGWSHFDLHGTVAREFDKPVGFDTDVNAAGLAEARWGGGKAVASLVYVTVGTGIGAGVIHNGASLVGLTHPEIGHIHLRRHPRDTGFAGTCPFHGDCLEGLASGTAILARTGKSLEDTGPDEPIWDIEADYLGQLCAQLVVTVSPHRILLGGGVMQQERLFPLIRTRMRHWLQGYVQHPELSDSLFVSPPGLGIQSGVKGALVLALDAAQSVAPLFR